MGPPTDPPYWLRLSVSWVGAKKLRAFKSPLRTNSNRSPWISLVPDLVTMLTTAPAPIPYWAETLSVCTLNSCTASGFANKLEQISMDFISAGLGHDVDHRAGPDSILGRNIVGLHVEFLHRIGIGEQTRTDLHGFH